MITATFLGNNPTVATEVARLILTVAKLLDEDTLECVFGMLSEDPFDDDTRETVRGILMEALDAVGMGKVVCDRLFAFLDIKKQQQQQQIDTTTANTLPIATPPTNTKSRPTLNTKKTHIHPTDQ